MYVNTTSVVNTGGEIMKMKDRIIQLGIIGAACLCLYGCSSKNAINQESIKNTSLNQNVVIQEDETSDNHVIVLENGLSDQSLYKVGEDGAIGNLPINVKGELIDCTLYIRFFV